MSRRTAAKAAEATQEEAVLADLNELANAIEQMSDLGDALLNRSRLKRRTICLLIRDACGPGVGIIQIEKVLDAITGLKSRYLKEIKSRG